MGFEFIAGLVLKRYLLNQCLFINFTEEKDDGDTTAQRKVEKLFKIFSTAPQLECEPLLIFIPSSVNALTGLFLKSQYNEIKNGKQDFAKGKIQTIPAALAIYSVFIKVFKSTI